MSRLVYFNLCISPLLHNRVGLSKRQLIAVRYDYESEDYESSVREDGFCRPYGGVACSPYIGNKVVYLSHRFRPDQVEDSLKGRIVFNYRSQMSNELH